MNAIELLNAKREISGNEVLYAVAAAKSICSESGDKDNNFEHILLVCLFDPITYPFLKAAGDDAMNKASGVIDAFKNLLAEMEKMKI